MNKIVYALITLAAFTSCMSSYNIQGSSNMATLDGHKMYLKILKNQEFKNIDSCDIVHGQFHFSGTIDSVRMGNVFMDDQNVLPVVLESGDIIMRIDNTRQTVSGTPLNDKLSQFLTRYNQLKSQEDELVHKHDQAIMNGKDMRVVTAQLNAEAHKITAEEDRLITTFVTENFDNVLGPGIFFMVTITDTYPELTPWIDDIMSKATDNFKNDPYVKDYYEKAQENQQIMNGMKEVPQTAVPSQAPAPQTAVPAPAPTPNELAKPAE